MNHGCFLSICSVSTDSACPIVLVNRPGSLPMSSIVYKLSTTSESNNNGRKTFQSGRALV